MQRLLLIPLLLLALQAFPCANEYGHGLDGQIIHSRLFHLSKHYRSFDTTALDSRIRELRHRIDGGDTNYKLRSDLAVNLMKRGQVQESLEILQTLSEQYPNQYNIAANLGTAYELSNELDSALKYIRKGYAINPKSHRSSEWVHIKILEAKIKAHESPHWLIHNRIIPVDTLLEYANHKPHDFHRIDRQIAYQIRTRVPFTPAPNAVIRNLLLSYGEAQAEIGTYENAILAYAYAYEFSLNYHQWRYIDHLVEALNQKRAALEDPPQIHGRVLHLLNHSNLDPTLLILGLEDFAEEQDSIDHKQLALQDSLNHFQEKTDSLQARLNYFQETLNQRDEEASNSLRWWGIVGGILGLILTLGYFRNKQKSKPAS